MNLSIFEHKRLIRIFTRRFLPVLPDFVLLVTGLILIVEYRHLLLFHHIVIAWLAFDGIVERFERPFLIRAGLWAAGLVTIDLISVLIGHIPSDRVFYIPVVIGVIGTALYMANRERRMNRMRNELADMVVHDMKGPLQVIMGYTELLLDTPEQPFSSADHEAILHIRSSSQALLKMTTMLLDIERIRAQHLKIHMADSSVDRLFEQLCEQYRQFATERGVMIHYEACHPGQYATLDWGLIERVAENLLINAIKHSPPGSSVQIKSCTREDDLQIDVVDQGEGISPEDLKHIFERFIQSTHRRYGNKTDTGLGLSFCKLAVEAHGGRISVSSTLGSGSTFTVHLPRNTHSYG